MTASSRVTIFVTIFCAACEAQDTAAPPPPVVDPIPSPTASTRIQVTGSAEYDAVVLLEGGVAPVTVRADAFTALWRADVELAPDRETTISVTATDEARNASAPTEVKVVHAAARPAAVQLTLGTPTARAGELVALVATVVDQYGHDLPEAAVSFEVVPALAPSFTVPGSSPAVTKEQGVLPGSRQFVAYDLSGVQGAGRFELKATAGGVSDTRVLTVRPAAAQAFSKLAFTSGPVPATVVAGEDVAYDYGVVDVYGNPTEGPVSAYTNAPGAIVVDDGVSGHGKVTRLTSAGAYALAFYIAGAGQQGSLPYVVGTAPGASVDVNASTTLTSPQAPVQVFARVRDAFGNLVSCTDLNRLDLTFTATGSTSGSSPAPAATACFNGAFRTSFTFASENTWAIAAAWAPSGAVAVSSTVFVTVLAFDNTPPAITLRNVTVNGTACNPAARAPAGCDVANGDTVAFEAVASDNLALAELSYAVFFETTQRLSARTVFVSTSEAAATVTFRFQVNAGVEVAPLVASAVDRAGNRENSNAVDIYVASGVPVGGRALVPIASGGSLNQPADVAVSSSGDVYVVNGNTSSLVRVPAGSGTPQVIASGNGGTQGDSVVVAGTGASERVYVGDSNNGRVYAFDLGGTNRQQLTTGVSYTGLAALGAVAGRAWVDATSGNDGAQVTLQQGATTEVYELDTNNNCSASGNKTCVSVASGASGAVKASALQVAIGSASGLVRAALVGAQVTLEARTPGESGSSPIALGASGGFTRSSSTLVEGHDTEIWTTNDNDNLIRRYFTNGTTHGQFDVGYRTGGLALRDVATPSSTALFDTLAYVTRRNGGNGTSQLEAFEILTQALAPNTQTTTVNSRFALNGTTVGSPQVSFSQIWDVALAPNGCLLASDAGNGSIYAIDTRTPKAFSGVAVERVARALPTPRGLGFAANGDLYIATSSGNAVFRLSPTADPNDCF